MNKRQLRTLGLGFLSSAILAGAFAIFFQGNVPIQGVKLSSVLSGTAHNDQELSSYKDAMSTLLLEKESLESSQKALNESLNSLKEASSKQSSELAATKKEGSSSQNESSVSAESSSATASNEESTQNAEQATNNSDTASQSASNARTFVVYDGDSSLMIADRLVSEGFLDTTEDFKYIVEQFGLASILRTGTYEFTPNMGPHEILSALTNNAYYYVP